ncbi:ATP-dependent protease LonB [Anaerotignum faecicola]|nr:ATP-dependent protease LonB [Anaerotignum faecicola]
MVVIIGQLIFTVIAGMYFYGALKNQRNTRSAGTLESSRAMERIQRMRKVKLTEPLAEKVRPKALGDIIGQEEGIEALRAALCGKNPQHVIIYGPPGIGKTAAARLMLEEAKNVKGSPFAKDAPFIEMDATTIRFDERSIADPLMGSVHDPIYQGAGAYGAAGVPQPKEGAVTKANGGILFIDEIGELHPMQMNKLLKVLEDRKVFLTSAYYNSDSKTIPKHVHDIFQNGLPADFRLVGATTRSPEDIPPALRSRCTEIFFDSLKKCHIKRIAENAAESVSMEFGSDAAERVTMFASSGREAVNIMQTAATVALLDERNKVLTDDIERVVKWGRYSPRIEFKVPEKGRPGCVNGLGVFGSGGTLLTIEAWAKKAENGKGRLKVTGIVEEEEIKNGSQTMKRSSTAKSSVQNVLTLLERDYGIDYSDYNIHLNFPGGIPVDGPSAGIAIFTAIYSAVTNKIPDPSLAMTGEISICGRVLPVGGVPRKIEAAVEAGAKRVIIPKDNFQKSFEKMDIEIIAVEKAEEILNICFIEENKGILTA